MSQAKTRERILRAAKELFLARGFAGTSVDEVCARAGVTKGSVYYFFKSKEGLGLAVLEWSLQESSKILMEGAYTELSDPVERALGFVEHAEKNSGQIWSGGCLLGSFAIELAETNDRVQEAVAQTFDAVTDTLETTFAPIAQAAPTAPGARQLAEEYLEVLEGAIILGKAYRDWTRIPRALKRFRRYLASLIETPAGTSAR